MLLVPFTRRDPRVETALPVSATWVDVSKDGHAYWRAMDVAWRLCIDVGDDLIVVEHDVEVHGDVVAQFDKCPELWCVFGYDNMCHPECMEAWANMLGCTRFRVELMAACPDAVSSIPPELRVWNNLCDHIAGNKVNGTPAPQNPKGVRTKFGHHWHTPPIHHISWEGHPR